MNLAATIALIHADDDVVGPMPLMLAPLTMNHPPSLRNPVDAPVTTAQTGWEVGAKKAARAKALEDLKLIVDDMLRQTGKPTIAHQATYPLWPAIGQGIC